MVQFVDVTPASDSGSHSFSHVVPSGSDRLLLVAVTARSTALVTAVTYDGVGLTLIASEEVTGGQVARRRSLYLYGMVDPPVGTADVSVTADDTDTVVAAASNWTGVDQSEPWGTPASKQQSGAFTDISVSALSSSDDLVVDTFGYTDNNNDAPGAGQTERWNATGDGGVLQAGSTKPGGVFTTLMGWTFDNATPNSAIIAVALHPAGEEPEVLLSGTSQTEMAGSGHLAADRALAGISATETDGSGTLARTVSLAGTSATETAGSGALSRTRTLAGLSATETAGSGTLARETALAGTGQTVTAGSGDLSVETGFDPANLVAVVDGSDVHLTWDPSPMVS